MSFGVRSSLGAQQQRSAAGSAWIVQNSWARGLPGSPVRGLLEARDGYLLLGTEIGLLRFDGVRFTLVRHPSSTGPDSIPDDNVHAMSQASDGSVWLAGAHFGAIQLRGGTFQRHWRTPGFPDYEANHVIEDSRGVIWAGTVRGLAYREGERFVQVPGLAGVRVMSLAEGADRALWIGTEIGLYRYQNGTLEQIHLPNMSRPRVLAVHRGRDGVMWVGTWQGLVRMERRGTRGYVATRIYTTRDGANSSYVQCITEQSDGTIWIGTLGGGVSRLDASGRFESFDNRDGLTDNTVYSILADRSDNIWVGTADGLNRLRKPILTMWRGPGLWTAAMTWSVRADRDGTIWVGTGADGLVRIEPSGATRIFTTDDGLPSNVVLMTYRARDGTLWVGTRRGIARQRGARFQDMTAALGLPEIGVRSMHEDAQGRFSIGTDSSLTVERPGGRIHLRHSPPMPASRVYGVTHPPDGRLVAAAYALSYVSGDSLAIWVSAQGDTVRSSLDLKPDTAGIWVGAGMEGLALIRHDSLFRFPSRRTGVMTEVLNVQDDGRGNLWLSGGRGVQRVRKADLVAWVRDSTHRINMRWYSKADGLRSEDFAKSGDASAALAPDGRLWLPTTSGVVVIDPRAVIANPMVPQAHIERVLADGVPMPMTGPVHLPRGARSVIFEFTTPLLPVPSQARLWFRLDGVDRDWRRADPLNRMVEYAHLPRGTFTFRVRAENEDGVPSAADATWSIISTPPLTRLPAFWVVLVLLVSSTATFAYRRRVGTLRRNAMALQRIIDERTEALATRARLEQQLLHSQKLESVGRLAGGVAHDLNNLLTAVIGHAELALGEPDVPRSVVEDLAEVRAASTRAADLTRQLLTFARKQVVEPRIVRLGDLVANLDKLLRGLVSEDVEVLLEAQEEDWVVRADPSQLEQVLLNLAANARDAMPHGGTLRVTTRQAQVDDAFAAMHPELAPGDYVVLEVADDGEGMSPEVQGHLFEPFFTTKAPGKGTGLGLATSYGIVTQVGGQILVESQVGKGTTFRLYFPRTGGTSTAVVAEPAAMPRGTERVLLVEDEPAVRDVAERTLRALGYNVVTAVDGEDALARLQETRGVVDLMVTDLRMPRMSGVEAAQRAREQWKALKILFMSGHAEEMFEGIDRPDVRLLRKPFTASQLAVAVRHTLDAGQA